MMFEHWGEFYLLAGSAAAVLIGLIFVVVTLMRTSRARHDGGARLYMGPVVLHVSFMLVLSAAALARGWRRPRYRAGLGRVAVWGLDRRGSVDRGIRELVLAGRPAALDRHMVLWGLPGRMLSRCWRGRRAFWSETVGGLRCCGGDHRASCWSLSATSGT